MQQTTPPRARFPAIEREDDIRPPPPPLTTWRKERYDPFTFQSLSASGPLRLVVWPASEKKRITFPSLTWRKERYDPFAFQSLSASGPLRFAHHLVEEVIRSIRLPVPHSLWTSQVNVMVSLREIRGRHSFTFSFTHLAEGALRYIRLTVPFSLWTSQVSVTASLREKEDDFCSPPPSLTWRKERYGPFAFQSLSALDLSG